MKFKVFKKYHGKLTSTDKFHVIIKEPILTFYTFVFNLYS